jgi:YD repeat-containing protein
MPDPVSSTARHAGRAGVSALVHCLGLAAAILLVPSTGYAIDRSQCIQYGGSSVCFMPVIGRWKYDVCGEVGAFQYWANAKCVAQGGTPAGWDCNGLPPAELWRPTTEGDIVPLAVDTVLAAHGAHCEGPTAAAYTWGANISSILCSTAGPGAQFVQGYEKHNNTSHFLVSGKQLNAQNQCANTSQTTFSASRDRVVECPGFGDQSYLFTTGSTPALCSLGANIINPRQCNDCGSTPTNPVVGNPIDPFTGVKRQVELDYAGSGPQPLRFERVYHSRMYVLDGKNWRHNYSARIEFHDFGTVPVAFAHRAGGRAFAYRQIGGVFTPDVDINDKLTKLTDAGGALTGWEFLEVSTDTLETYDVAGRLLSIRNRAGLTQTLEYSTASTPPAIAAEPGLLIRVTDAFGRSLNFTYDKIGRMLTMQDPAGQTYSYAWNSYNVITSVTYPGAKVRTYHYGEGTDAHRLTGITDENNSRFASYFYTGATGMAFRTEHAGPVDRVSIEASGWPNSVVVTDPLGTARTYTYQNFNGVRLITGITQPAAVGSGTVSSAITYGTNNNVSMRRDFNGNRTNYTAYDLTRNLETSRTEGLTSAGATTPATRTIETQWHASFRLPTQITEKNGAGTVLRTTSMSYDTSGNLLTRTITAGASSRTWTYTYNANGSVLTVDGPRTDVSDVTTYTYYDNSATCPGTAPMGCRGQVQTITNAVGHVTEITEYNAHGQPLTIVDPNGLHTDLAYDSRLRLTSRSVAGEATSYVYDDAGQLILVTLPDGSFLAYTYDASHRLTEISDNQGNRITYSLDNIGNRTLEEVRDPLNALAQTRTRVFNSLNRLIQDIGALGQTTVYGHDNQGNVTSIDGPLAGTGDTTANLYDALNRLIRVTQPGGGQINYGYNALDQLTSVSDPRSLVTTYGIDGLGNLNLQTSPDTGTTSSTYDAAGNVLTQTDAKTQVTSYAYDALNRVTSITYQGGVVHGYQYDQGVNGKGRLTQITEPNSTTQYVYDQKGRLTAETRTINGVAYVTSYAYDTLGRMESVTYPSGRQLIYSFDSMGRVQKIDTLAGSAGQTIVSSVEYQPFGPVRSFTFGNGQTFTRTYDQDGRIASYSQPWQSFSVGYDPASRINAISENGNPLNFNTYSYDNIDRLTQAILPTLTYSFGYDAVGNRTTRTAGSSTHNYAYSGTSNRLSTITPVGGPVRTYTHDANGSVTADGVNTYGYDTRGRMTQAVSAIGTTSYQVNSLGQRIRKTNSQSDTVYHYDKEGRLIAESSPGGTIQKEYIYLGDIPVAVIQ